MVASRETRPPPILTTHTYATAIIRHVSDHLYQNFACLLRNGVIAPPKKNPAGATEYSMTHFVHGHIQ